MHNALGDKDIVNIVFNAAPIASCVVYGRRRGGRDRTESVRRHEMKMRVPLLAPSENGWAHRRKRDRALQMALLAPYWGHISGNTSKKQKVVGKNLISGLMIVLGRPVYASGHYKCS